MSAIASPPARGVNRFNICICGAGIGGLALALALSRRGIAATVIERRRAEQIRGDGLFLTLAPNGINALRAIGLAEGAIAAGFDTKGIAIFNERGQRLALINYGTHRHRFGAPSVTIGRGALGGLLLDAAMAAGIELRLGEDIVDLNETATGLDLHTVARTAAFDAAIACDGLRSTVRRLAFPSLPQPRYTGLIGIGGVVDLPALPPTDGIMNMTFGRRAFFGYLKPPGHPVLWFNSYPAPESAIGGIADPRAYAAKLRSLHTGDPLANSEILDAVDGIERNYPIYDMPSLEHWSTPHVLLMGDAAHAVAPHSGQGASMAIEDAVVLAACLDGAESPAAAFARFEQLRRARGGNGDQDRSDERVAKACPELAAIAAARPAPAAGDADGRQGARADVWLSRRSQAAGAAAPIALRRSRCH